MAVASNYAEVSRVADAWTPSVLWRKLVAMLMRRW